jgi:hypothetical protein
MNRTEILSTAEALINGDRQEEYGYARDSLGLIAAYWSAHLDHPVSASDVAVMMALLKLARAKASPQREDSWIDGAGYIALAGEMATEAA